VSPHTFYTYLLVILHGLRGMKLEDRARHIQGELGTLAQEFERFWDAIRKVGGHLANAQRQYAEGERQAGVVRTRLDRITGVDLAVEADQPPALQRPEPFRDAGA
jgi:DNA recombination protein RmuC